MNPSTVLFGAAAIVASLLFSAAARADQSARPNILVIVGDDMGYADIGVHGCHDIPTPHLDELAAAGVRCTNGYVSGPYCSPTRAGMLTGRYQTRFGHEFNPSGGRQRRGRRQREAQTQARGDGGNESGMPVSETTMADGLKSAGYNTGLIGKWHLGNADQFHPLRRGFDEFFGFLGGAHSYFPGERTTIVRGRERVDEQEYLTDAFGREAVAFIERHADEPFFLYLAFNAVHTPMHADDARLEKFQHIADKQRRIYAGMMSAMDDAIGEVLAKLREEKLEENTLVFFISDNGGPTLPTTTVNASSNEPLRGSKRTTLEGGIRVPFFVTWPGQLPAGETYDELVIQLDILPTALAAAGIDVPGGANLDGMNLLPYLRGEQNGKPHDALYWRFGQQMAIREGDWKLVRYDPAADGEKGAAKGPHLYNVAKDIGEQHNLLESEPQRAAALQAKWDEWNESNVPPRWGGGGR
jgi:arylsulfatase A-like enzyme